MRERSLVSSTSPLKSGRLTSKVNKAAARLGLFLGWRLFRIENAEIAPCWLPLQPAVPRVRCAAKDKGSRQLTFTVQTLWQASCKDPQLMPCCIVSA
jgi:hypothetical protein